MHEWRDAMPQIPDDFPRRTSMGGVGVAAPKFLARITDDGQYSAFVSDGEHRPAYERSTSTPIGRVSSTSLAFRTESRTRFTRWNGTLQPVKKRGL